MNGSNDIYNKSGQNEVCFGGLKQLTGKSSRKTSQRRLNLQTATGRWRLHDRKVCSVDSGPTQYRFCNISRLFCVFFRDKNNRLRGKSSTELLSSQGIEAMFKFKKNEISWQMKWQISAVTGGVIYEQSVRWAVAETARERFTSSMPRSCCHPIPRLTLQKRLLWHSQLTWNSIAFL